MKEEEIRKNICNFSFNRIYTLFVIWLSERKKKKSKNNFIDHATNCIEIETEIVKKERN